MEKEVSAVCVSPLNIELREFEVPSIGPQELLIEVEAVGVCGTDVEMFEGRKSAPFPIIFGHETVGRVYEVGHEAAKIYNVKQGDRVVLEPYIMCKNCEYCLRGHYQLCKNMRCYGVTISCEEPPHLWGAYGEYVYVAPGSRVHKISEDVPVEAAALATVVGNGIRWVCTKGKVDAGDVVVVLGPGAQGLVSTMVSKYRGADMVILVGLSRDRRRLALGREFGADYVVEADKEDVIERVKELTDGEMADVVISCAPSPTAIKLGVDLLKPLGTYVMVALIGKREVPIATDKVVMKELKILGGLGQALNVETAIKLMEKRVYPIEKLVTHVFPLEKAEEALKVAGYKVEGEEPIKVVIKPRK